MSLFVTLPKLRQVITIHISEKNVQVMSHIEFEN